MSKIFKNYQQIASKLPVGVDLCAVSKFHPVSEIQELYDHGCRIFGENRPVEFAQKAAELPADIEWHFIGHLQTNKVKMVVPAAHLIESIDSLRLLTAIDNMAQKVGKKQRILLQMHIAQEESKQGLSAAEIEEIMARRDEFQHVDIVGLMGMASFSDNTQQIEGEFHTLHAVYQKFPHLTTLSMGMSGDWELAVECGSTNIRVGSAIFNKN